MIRFEAVVPDFICAAGQRFAHDPHLSMETAGSTLQPGPVLTAELCEIPVQVSVAEAAPLFDLDISQFGAYRFDAQNSLFTVLRPAQTADLAHEAFHGPLLLHALAHRQIFVMHASGLQRADGSVLLFCANSGVGKSTLANIGRNFGWHRVADDLLPVTVSNGQILALPHLQQPKLADDQQYPAEAPATLPLAAFVDLRRGAALALTRLDGVATMDRVLRNTVATRVFAQASLRAHLDFCRKLAIAATAGQVAALELSMADRSNDISGAVREALDLLESTLS